MGLKLKLLENFQKICKHFENFNKSLEFNQKLNYF